MVRRVKNMSARKWCEDSWARIFVWFREYDLQGRQGMQESQTEEVEMRQQQRMNVMTEIDKENQVKGLNGRKQQLVGQ